MSDLKLGALAPVRPYGLSDLTVYAAGKLPAAPAVAEVPTVADWQMFGNGPDPSLTVNHGQPVGDCTIAGAAHAILAWNAEVKQHDVVPTANQVVDAYFGLTGGADAGCVEANVLSHWHKTGLFGHQIAGYAPVHTNSISTLFQAIAFYGGAYLGVALPESAQEQFARGQDWSYVPFSPIEGGHCILAVGYDTKHDVVQCVTWGSVVNVRLSWLAHYMTEAWAIISHEFIEAERGPRLDLATLQADLKSL